MNLYEILSKHNKVYWHDKKPSNMSVMETRKASTYADVYISSVNGISEDGEIVNIDVLLKVINAMIVKVQSEFVEIFRYY